MFVLELLASPSTSAVSMSLPGWLDPKAASAISVAVSRSTAFLFASAVCLYLCLGYLFLYLCLLSMLILGLSTSLTMFTVFMPAPGLSTLLSESAVFVYVFVLFTYIF